MCFCENGKIETFQTILEGGLQFFHNHISWNYSCFSKGSQDRLTSDLSDGVYVMSWSQVRFDNRFLIGDSFGLR